MRTIFVTVLLFACSSVLAQSEFTYPDDLRFASEAEEGIYQCLDTMKVYVFRHVAEISVMLPSWRPVMHHDSVSVLEGRVMPIPGHPGPAFQVPAVSFEDLPLYHYTHDFAFNVFPDSAYRDLLSRYIRIRRDSAGNEIRDTVIRDWIHCEWESGIGAGNKGNKHAEVCREGGSAGYASVGHERYDVIWNWPTVGDWVHVEGLWVWDRGHPPAKTEIHPMRFMATRRNLPDKIRTEQGDSVFATRVDLYANGDGSVFYNNQDTNSWARPIRMSSKDYSFEVRHTLPQPSPEARMRYVIRDQKGNSYEGQVEVDITAGTNEAGLRIPWRSVAHSDTAVLAKTLHLYWDEGIGVPEDYAIHTYEVKLEKLRIRRLSEIFFLTPAELRMFAEVGGKYIFLNEHVTGRKDILRAGLGRTIRRNWRINRSFTVHVPEDKVFRVYAGGWEADGVDKAMGHVVDQNAGCNTATKELINDLMLDPTPVGYGGCEDDNMGESITYHGANDVAAFQRFISSGEGNPYEENCPLGKRTPVDFHRLEYSIRRK